MRFYDGANCQADVSMWMYFLPCHDTIFSAKVKNPWVQEIGHLKRIHDLTSAGFFSLPVLQ